MWCPQRAGGCGLIPAQDVTAKSLFCWGSLLLVWFGGARQENPWEAQMLWSSPQTEPSLVYRVRNGEVSAQPGAGCHL